MYGGASSQSSLLPEVAAGTCSLQLLNTCSPSAVSPRFPSERTTCTHTGGGPHHVRDAGTTAALVGLASTCVCCMFVLLPSRSCLRSSRVARRFTTTFSFSMGKDDPCESRCACSQRCPYSPKSAKGSSRDLSARVRTKNTGVQPVRVTMVLMLFPLLWDPLYLPGYGYPQLGGRRTPV